MTQPGAEKRIGLIAGSGQFPLIFARKAREKGYAIYVVAHLKETEPAIESLVDGIEWVHLGQIKRLLKFFKNNRITEAAMVGAIKKTRMFTDVRPDSKALALISSMRHTHDDGLLRAFASFLEREGVQIQASTLLLPELMATPGCWTRRKPSREETADVELGWRLAKEIGRLDIGQCIVLAGGSVLAVEAIDGTDATIRRGARLGNGRAIVVKVCKPTQDDRFDMPAVGAQTIQTMAEADARVLVIEAGKAVVFDRQEMIDLADQAGICILAKREN
jgi:UDP-2,3-diacylglucosamine hydrolase